MKGIVLNYVVNWDSVVLFHKISFEASSSLCHYSQGLKARKSFSIQRGIR